MERSSSRRNNGHTKGCGRIVAAMGRQNQRAINPIGSSHGCFFAPRGLKCRDQLGTQPRSPYSLRNDKRGTALA